MCGIFAICHDAECTQKFDLDEAKQLSKMQSHRGPDFRGAYQHPTTGNILCHERLAIMDLNCTQPIQGRLLEHQVIHNGEIYNYRELFETECHGIQFRTTCDSEILIHLYEKYRSIKGGCSTFCNALRGVFAFALIYENEFLVARDPIGVKPAYYGRDALGRHFFSNELKVIEKVCGKEELRAFPPGHYFTLADGFVQYYKPNWFNYELAVNDTPLQTLRDALIDSTHRRLVSDAPIAVLLSGGLDSSLISAIAARYMRQLNQPINSFSIGINADAPDLIAARKIAKFLGTQHHEIHFTVEEGADVLRQLIWHLESYDVTTIRASTPMFFLSRYIASKGIKVVLSGEGADEVFGGYLYFHNAPNDQAFQKELIRRVRLLSTADCLRADKSCMAHGLEVRVPFLDRQFLDIAMSMAPKHKRPHEYRGRPTEKWVLRKAFDDHEDPFIPHDILWRQKEQFSDGVGYGWIDHLVEHCSSKVTDEELRLAPTTFPYNTPTTKEALYIRKIFAEFYPSDNAAKTVIPWVPVWQINKDPSGRASHVHENTKQTTGGKGEAENGVNGNELTNLYGNRDRDGVLPVYGSEK